MKVKAYILLLLISFKASALITLADTGNTKFIKEVISTYKSNTHHEETQEKTINLSLALGFPVKSKASQGVLTSKRVEVAPYLKNKPLFIVGSDAVSLEWLASHKGYLQRHHAVGFITNINTHNQYQEITQKYELPLQPVNVDDLMVAIKAYAYPVYFDGESIWQ